MWRDLLTQAVVISVLATTIQSATPILLAALGETIAESAGIYNIGLEGTMLSGAFAAYMATWSTGSPWLGALAGIGGGMAATLILASLSVLLRHRTNRHRAGDQPSGGRSLRFPLQGRGRDRKSAGDPDHAGDTARAARPTALARPHPVSSETPDLFGFCVRTVDKRDAFIEP